MQCLPTLLPRFFFVIFFFALFADSIATSRVSQKSSVSEFGFMG
jgi:hypothetical protein